MPQIKNSIVIHADIDTVFDVTNDIERWPELFDEYQDAKIIKREGNYVTFELVNLEGHKWQSTRFIDKAHYQCTAERGEPKFPFLYMNLKWVYEVTPDGTLMTWMQDFEMDPKSSFTNAAAEKNMNEHSRSNMQRIKDIIEKETKK